VPSVTGLINDFEGEMEKTSLFDGLQHYFQSFSFDRSGREEQETGRFPCSKHQINFTEQEMYRYHMFLHNRGSGVPLFFFHNIFIHPCT
jgi:hypothetical protein